MDSASRRRLMERVRESASEARNERVFRNAAEETSDTPSAFINVKDLPNTSDFGIDKLKNMSITEREEEYGEDWYKPFFKDLRDAEDQYRTGVEDGVIKQLDDQQPGLGSAFKGFIVSETGSDFGYYALSEIVEGSPAAWLDFEFKEQPFCVIKEPSEKWDNAHDFIIDTFKSRPLLKHVDASVVENFGMSDFDYNKAVGAHEGEHCNHDSDIIANERERLSDVSEVKVVDDHDFSSAMNDYRHLSADETSTVHSIGTLLEYGQEGNILHAEGAFYHSSKMAIMVNDNYEWVGDTSKMTGAELGSIQEEEEWKYKVQNPDFERISKVLENDPEGFFKAVGEGVEDYKQDVMARYKQDPSHDNLRDVMRAEISIDYIQNFEAAYQRRFLGQIDTPVPAQTKLVDVNLDEFVKADLARNELIGRAMALVDFSVDDFEVFAFKDFDFTPYQEQEKDYDHNDLRIDHPDKYFDTLEDAEADFVATITDGAEPEHLNSVTLLAEEVVNSVRNYEYNYRTETLNQIVPEPQNVDFLGGEGEEMALKHIEMTIEEEEAKASGSVEVQDEAAEPATGNDLDGWDPIHGDDVISVGPMPTEQPVQSIKPVGM